MSGLQTKTSFFAVNHLWTEASATITAVGIGAVAITPLLSGNPPTSASGWVTEAIAIATALMKAFGKS